MATMQELTADRGPTLFSHGSYGFVPAGFFLAALSALDPAHSISWLTISALAWAGASFGFSRLRAAPVPRTKVVRSR
jgi:hypothetical protein